MFPSIFIAVTLAYVAITSYAAKITLKELIFVRKPFLTFERRVVGIFWPKEVKLISISPIDHNY